MSKGSRFPRRALITAAATAGLCSVAVAVPRVVPSVEQHVEQAALVELKGVSIDAALVHAVVASWQAGLTALPIAPNAYTTADITSAETYLRALKKPVHQQ
ncbi:MAG: hypothetical protein ACLQUY_09860 [Ktedonobacterales bacterium]